MGEAQLSEGAVNYSLEKRLFGAMVWGEALTRHRHAMRADVFGSIAARKAAGIYIEQYDRLGKPPTLSEVKLVLKADKSVEGELAYNFVVQVGKMPREQTVGLYDEQLEALIRTQHMHTKLSEAAELALVDMDKAQHLVRESMSTVRPMRTKAYTYKDRRAAYKSGNPQGRGKMWRTPYTYMNALLGGGPCAGEVHLIGGDRGTGKTRQLVNLARQHVADGAHVVYITYEMTEDQLHARLDQIITNRHSSEFLDECPHCHGHDDDCPRCDGVGTVPREETMVHLDEELERLHRKGGRIDVYKLSPNAMSMQEIRAFVRALEAKPDVLFVDYDEYVRLVKVHNDIWRDQAEMYKEYVALCEEEQILGYLAAQSVKGGGTGSENADFSGSAGKLDPVSSAWMIKVDKHDRRKVYLKNAKNRFGEDKKTVLLWASRRNGMLLTSEDEDPEQLAVAIEAADAATREILEDTVVAQQIIDHEKRVRAMSEVPREVPVSPAAASEPFVPPPGNTRRFPADWDPLAGLDRFMAKKLQMLGAPVLQRDDLVFLANVSGLEPRALMKRLRDAGWGPRGGSVGMCAPKWVAKLLQLEPGAMPPLVEQIRVHADGVEPYANVIVVGKDLRRECDDV